MSAQNSCVVGACSIKVRGVVQGVGFRPFVFRLAQENTLAGWVRNGEEGVEIFLEGADTNLKSFVERLKTSAPRAAQIAEIEVEASAPVGLSEFTIRESRRHGYPTTRISPDLAICDDCLKELFDPADARYRYPYINCTNCGPRYSVALSLPYDRQNTTMRYWPLDKLCREEYLEPSNRRFHAQPLACPACGPVYYLLRGPNIVYDSELSVRKAAEMLANGEIVAIKGLGGYHLACDATNRAAVKTLRVRKYRKEKPFAVMARDLAAARKIIDLSPDAEALLISIARPIVIAPARADLEEVAPGSRELGVMLPYTPVHHLLFESGAPEVLVMTSANRSSEPIAYEDSDALDRLSSLADAFLIGERTIARRVDDSVARAGFFGTAILRRSRGYSPGVVTTLPVRRPILALGADLKNTITLVVDGQAFVSQHIGDLSDYRSLRAFRETIDDLVAMYGVDWNDLVIVHDSHPRYLSTTYAQGLVARRRGAVQHHRAHIASVLAERQECTRRIVGVSLDGTGYGDDGTIWGGEIFAGNVQEGFARIAHRRRAALPGGDAAAQYPVQAAAGFLAQVEGLPDLRSHPFSFPQRYHDAMELVSKGVRSFTTTSMGRLFDAAAAVLGFMRAVTFEGQAAVWLEQLARTGTTTDSYPLPFDGQELDFRPLLRAAVEDRAHGREPAAIARAFQRGIAEGLGRAITAVSSQQCVDTVVLSGGVFQNELLLEDLYATVKGAPLTIWTNHHVPPNDGGISLGQAALAAFHRFDGEASEAPDA